MVWQVNTYGLVPLASFKYRWHILRYVAINSPCNFDLSLVQKYHMILETFNFGLYRTVCSSVTCRWQKDLNALCSLQPHYDNIYQLTTSTMLQQWGPDDAADKPGLRLWTSNCRAVGEISSSVVFQCLRGFSCWYWTLKRTTGRLSLFTGIDHSTSTELSDFFVTVGRDGGIRCTASENRHPHITSFCTVATHIIEIMAYISASRLSWRNSVMGPHSKKHQYATMH